MKMTPLELIEKRLKDHDYTYENSDDHRYWVAGTKDKEDIRAIIKNHLVTFPEDKAHIIQLIIKHRSSEYGTNFIIECGL
jgi:hypothetical protein